MAIRGGDESSDWLDFYIPLDALDHAGLAYWDGQPFFRSNVMDDWLAAIGTETFETASVSLGVVGFEVSGCTAASTLAGKLQQTRGVGYPLRRATSCTTAPPTPDSSCSGWLEPAGAHQGAGDTRESEKVFRSALVAPVETSAASEPGHGAAVPARSARWPPATPQPPN